MPRRVADMSSSALPSSGRPRRADLRGRSRRSRRLGGRRGCARAGSRTSSPRHAQQLDLRDQSEVSHWFKANRPEYVFLVAGTVGGIMANSTRPAEFIYDNMMIHGTVVHASHRVRRHASCSTSARRASIRARRRSRSPRTSCSPVRWSRPTSGTRSPRSPASSCARPTAGSTAATSSRRCRPTCTARTTTSTSRRSHVLPALIRKFHDAKATGATRGRDLGHRVADARVPPRRRSRRRLPVPDGALQRRQPHQRRHRRRPVDPRARREGPRHRLPRRRSCGSTRPSPTARRARCSTSPSSATSAGSRRSISTPASARTYQWFLDQQAAHAELRGVAQPVAVGSGTS